MSSKSLPPRPSLESLRKRAKKVARERGLTLRSAQLAIAREYGFAGWQDLTAEVNNRLGSALEWAVAQARRAIHDNNVDRLKQLVTEHPALLSWRGDVVDGEGSEDGLLGLATASFGDSFDPDREQTFTRGGCAEVLIDAGALVTPAALDSLVQSRARGLLQLFQRKGLLPGTLKFLSALGDIDAVRAALDTSGPDLAAVNEAFLFACGYEHEAVGALLLDRSMALDPELAGRVDGLGGRSAFIGHFIGTRPEYPAHAAGPWRLLVMQQVMRAVDGDPAAFVSALQRESWLVGDAYLQFQADVVGRATLHDRGDIIVALLDLDPALLRRQPPSQSSPFEFAFTYAKLHLVPLLERVWALPDDLPHAAGMGDLSRVKQWFDEAGAPALGDLQRHFPCNSSRARGMLRWGAPDVQQVLDTALAWSVMNRHFDVADFLLEHGADINTNWGSHEPASILHELVGQVGTGENAPNYESMQFLVDRGIDLTIEDYRWNATALGWAIHATNDQKLAAWLEDAERQRTQRTPSAN
jgi:hypothetical protein